MPTKIQASFLDVGALSGEMQDWQNVLTQLRDQLDHICKNEMVSADKEAIRIIVAMPYCGNMTEVDGLMDRLMVRVGGLLATATGDPSQLTRLLSQTRERGRAALSRNGRRNGFAAADDSGPSRTRFHL